MRRCFLPLPGITEKKKERETMAALLNVN